MKDSGVSDSSIERRFGENALCPHNPVSGPFGVSHF